MAIFAGKEWNDAVFMKYRETLEKVKQNAFLTAGIFRTRGDIKSTFDEQTGGNEAAIPIVGRIGGTPDNYNGVANITTDGIDSYIQNMIVVGRAHGWGEKDFTEELTRKDFMEEIAKQVNGYWADVDQEIILAILEGIFATTDAKSATFKNAHVYDISEAQEAEDKVVSAVTLNNALQKACGANKNIFKMVIMHSQVKTNLENLGLLQYAKGTDANGIQKDLDIPTWNGKTVLVDDDVPFDDENGVYTSYALGTACFDYADVGVVTPSEIVRDAKTAGGKTELITRQRKLYAPHGISFVQPTSGGNIISPTLEQLKTGARWKLVQNENGVIPHKAIPIVQIKSLG